MHEYPYTTNAPKGRITIENEDQLIELFISFLGEKSFYTFVKLTICPNRLRDKWANDMIERFLYCRSTGVPPYPGSYDDQPAVWLDVSKTIQSTIDDIKNCTCLIHRPPNG